MVWHLCTKLVICPLFNRLIQSWGEKGVSGELAVPLGKALRSLGQELSPPSQKKLESISLSLHSLEKSSNMGRGGGRVHYWLLVGLPCESREQGRNSWGYMPARAQPEQPQVGTQILPSHTLSSTEKGSGSSLYLGYRGSLVAGSVRLSAVQPAGNWPGHFLLTS